MLLLQADNTILGSSNLTCGGDRVVFIEHSTAAPARPASVAAAAFFTPADFPWEAEDPYNDFNKYKVPYISNFTKGEQQSL